MKNKTEYSQFWLGGKFSVIDSNDELDLVKLAAYRRAISNFVFILTGKSIPVRFSEKSTSVTDGKVIYIGGELSKGEVDSTVGLSLHEAMHIVKSDFTLLKNLWQKIPSSLYQITDGKFTKSFVADFVKYMLNVVEDRYIDAFAYESAPGYRGYYLALYDKYFNVPKVNKALKSKALRKPTIFAYKFRIVNLVNSNSDLDALPDLRKIASTIDISNILRLSHPQDRFDVAVEICSIIFQHVIDKMNEDDKKKSQGGNGDNQSNEKQESPSEKTEENKQGDSSGEENKDEEKPSEKESAEDKKEDQGPPDEDLEKDLSSVVDKQDQFINRQIKQKSIDQDTLKKLEELEKSGTEIVEVGKGWGHRVDCIVVKRMTHDLMDSESFPYKKSVSSLYSLLATKDTAENAVHQGMIFGTALGHKLQVRGESRTTKFNRQIQGKFDKRMMHGLGFDQETVFYRTTTDLYKDAHVHISVDASSSMQPNWFLTMKTLVAIAKAASMVNNLGVTISFRSGVERKDKERPYIVIAYDSKVDKLSKINHLFGNIYPHGTTPEGLTFEAILDLIPSTTPVLDSYFINISDGEPYFCHGLYSGTPGARHTKKQVEHMRNCGVYVSSYFIETDGSKMITNRSLFQEMYGLDAQFINLENITEIANTLNRRFLQKKS